MANQTRTTLLLLPLALLLALATAWTVPTPLQRPQVSTGKGRCDMVIGMEEGSDDVTPGGEYLI